MPRQAAAKRLSSSDTMVAWHRVNYEKRLPNVAYWVDAQCAGNDLQSKSLTTEIRRGGNDLR